jgi:hypothetical protein
MEWIIDNWYVAVLGLVAALLIFGYRPKKDAPHAEATRETTNNDKTHKSGHSCCH